jgi:hypothetical protein
MENSLRAELARAKIEADALAADNARLERLAAERQVPTRPDRSRESRVSRGRRAARLLPSRARALPPLR